jgi:transketolase C-terminal domain/subunit
VRVLVSRTGGPTAAVARGLRTRAWPSTSATTGRRLVKLDVNRYDVVVLDRDLPASTATRFATSWPARPPRPGS